MGDKAAAVDNAKLVGMIVQKLASVTSTDRKLAEAQTLPIILEFAASLQGDRRNKLSAWMALDLEIGGRLKASIAKVAALNYVAETRSPMFSQGRFGAGQRAGFGTDPTLIASPALNAPSLVAPLESFQA